MREPVSMQEAIRSLSGQLLICVFKSSQFLELWTHEARYRVFYDGTMIGDIDNLECTTIDIADLWEVHSVKESIAFFFFMLSTYAGTVLIARNSQMKVDFDLVTPGMRGIMRLMQDQKRRESELEND